ncbi:MAG: CehA/McbA family metallohydrolase [Clostridia bacterium]|nr:CehA/McbA family metallohydrolase [Clostridia bacterium]
MRTYLLPEDGRFYKANLHCHSVFSDGNLTVEALKEAYMQRGYSVIAYTDHDEFYRHNELTDDSFIAINSFEAGITEDTDWQNRKCYHFCCFARDPDRDYSDVDPDIDYYDTEAINAYIREMNEKGFLVQYNHPNWSLQTLDDIRDLEGIWGCEIFNTSSANDGFHANTELIYQHLLRQGKRICYTATDDNHNPCAFDEEQNDSFGGWTVIKTSDFSYAGIMDALEKRQCYASTGPEIRELYIEDGVVHVECSPARSIRFTTEGRNAKSINALPGEPLTCGEFKYRDGIKLVKVEVTGADGSVAYSNAYWLEDLGL